MTDFDIDWLARFPHDARLLAIWLEVEEAIALTRAEAERALQEQANRDRLPCVMVARERNQPIGCVILRNGELPIRASLGPWLSTLFVVPSRRRRGIGAALVRRAEATARALGHERLYLYTSGREDLYLGLGWRVAERANYRQKQISVMARDLAARDDIAPAAD